MKKFRKIFIAVALVSCFLVSSVSASTTDITFPVELRAGYADVTVTIHENTNAWRSGTTILAVHGLTGTAATWNPLIKEMFASRLWGKRIKRVIALDLPGHGKSPMPLSLAGGPFGNLLIDDNISVIFQTILYLQSQDLGPRVIMGHSMGGLAIQGLQESLLAQDLSLAKLGIYRAVLMAPVPAEGAEWNQGPAADLTPFIFGDPQDTVVGQYLYIPPQYAGLGSDFMNLDGITVPNVPTLEEFAIYGAPEPIYTLLQLVGQFPLPRPAAREGAFSICKGTLLNLISYSQDNLVPQADLDALYPYLTGSNCRMFYRSIDTDDACHNMQITNPKRVLKTLMTLPRF
ncbi:MAG: alpha/beta fold hydrolase [Proteobacteria bacterium]|nr:alpha/beta fold hydrolase [Pseudomonadota bacterium]